MNDITLEEIEHILKNDGIYHDRALQRYYDNKHDPEFKQKRRENSLQYYYDNREDPLYKKKRKETYNRMKNSPEFQLKKKLNARRWYLKHIGIDNADEIIEELKKKYNLTPGR